MSGVLQDDLGHAIQKGGSFGWLWEDQTFFYYESKTTTLAEAPWKESAAFNPQHDTQGSDRHLEVKVLRFVAHYLLFMT